MNDKGQNMLVMQKVNEWLSEQFVDNLLKRSSFKELKFNKRDPLNALMYTVTQDSEESYQKQKIINLLLEKAQSIVKRK